MAQIELKTAMDVAYAWSRMVIMRDQLDVIAAKLNEMLEKDPSVMEGPTKRMVHLLEEAFGAVCLASKAAGSEVQNLGEYLDRLEMPHPFVMEK